MRVLVLADKGRARFALQKQFQPQGRFAGRAGDRDPVAGPGAAAQDRSWALADDGDGDDIFSERE